MEIKKYLIDRAKEKRKELKITQGELSVLSGLTQQQISEIETYNRVPNIDTFSKYISPLRLELDVRDTDEFSKEVFLTAKRVSKGVEVINSRELSLMRETLSDLLNLIETELVFRSHYKLD